VGNRTQASAAFVPSNRLLKRSPSGCEHTIATVWLQGVHRAKDPPSGNMMMRRGMSRLTDLELG
jgi:hypothetical protein